MKIVTWNINGLRAVNKKGFKESIKKINPDVLCLQEIKADKTITSSKEFKLDGYYSYFHSAKKRGYSGVAIYTKVKPIKITLGIDDQDFDTEGRYISAEFQNFILINIYLPHSGRKTNKLDKKLEFNKKFENYIQILGSKKPLIICGDLNVAHTEIDLARPKDNMKNAGFTPEERNWFDKFMRENKFVDTFRYFNKQPGNYTWWTYRFHAREKNIGWRIDYVLISQNLSNKLKKAFIMPSIYGSDHCPAGTEIRI